MGSVDRWNTTRRCQDRRAVVVLVPRGLQYRQLLSRRSPEVIRAYPCAPSLQCR